MPEELIKAQIAEQKAFITLKKRWDLLGILIKSSSGY
jgi:hypothetical protein